MGIWGSKWKAEAPSTEQEAMKRKEWLEGINHLTHDQVRLGLQKCRTTLEWPVSIAEFISLCIDTPLPTIAYQNALNKKFDSPLVKKAFDMAGGSWALKTDPQFRKKFMDCYSDCIKNEQINNLSFKALSSSDKLESVSLPYDDSLKSTESKYDASNEKKKLEKERKVRLLAINEIDAQNLNRDDQIDRIIYLREKEANEYVREMKRQYEITKG